MIVLVARRIIDHHKQSKGMVFHVPSGISAADQEQILKGLFERKHAVCLVGPCISTLIVLSGRLSTYVTFHDKG